jgi:predicted permease
MKEDWIILLFIAYCVGMYMLIRKNRWRKRLLLVSLYGFISTTGILFLIEFNSINKDFGYVFFIFIIASIICWSLIYKEMKKSIEYEKEIKEKLERYDKKE